MSVMVSPLVIHDPAHGSDFEFQFSGRKKSRLSRGQHVALVSEQLEAIRGATLQRLVDAVYELCAEPQMILQLRFVPKAVQIDDPQGWQRIGSGKHFLRYRIPAEGLSQVEGFFDTMTLYLEWSFYFLSADDLPDPASMLEFDVHMLEKPCCSWQAVILYDSETNYLICVLQRPVATETRLNRLVEQGVARWKEPRGDCP